MPPILLVMGSMKARLAIDPHAALMPMHACAGDELDASMRVTELGMGVVLLPGRQRAEPKALSRAIMQVRL